MHACLSTTPPPLPHPHPPKKKKEKKEKKKGERLKADLTNKNRIIHSTRAASHVIHVQEGGVKKHQVTYLLACLHRKSQQRTFCLLSGTALFSSLKILPAQACGDFVLFARGSIGSAIFARMAGTVNTAQYGDYSLAEHSVAMYKPCLLRRTVEKLYDWEGSRYFRHAPLVSWKTIIFYLSCCLLYCVSLLWYWYCWFQHTNWPCTVYQECCAWELSRFFLCHEILENVS